MGQSNQHICLSRDAKGNEAKTHDSVGTGVHTSASSQRQAEILTIKTTPDKGIRG